MTTIQSWNQKVSQTATAKQSGLADLVTKSLQATSTIMNANANANARQQKKDDKKVQDELYKLDTYINKKKLNSDNNAESLINIRDSLNSNSVAIKDDSSTVIDMTLINSSEHGKNYVSKLTSKLQSNIDTITKQTQKNNDINISNDISIKTSQHISSEEFGLLTNDKKIKSINNFIEENIKKYITGDNELEPSESKNSIISKVSQLNNMISQYRKNIRVESSNKMLNAIIETNAIKSMSDVESQLANINSVNPDITKKDILSVYAKQAKEDLFANSDVYAQGSLKDLYSKYPLLKTNGIKDESIQVIYEKELNTIKTKIDKRLYNTELSTMNSISDTSNILKVAKSTGKNILDVKNDYLKLQKERVNSLMVSGSEKDTKQAIGIANQHNLSISSLDSMPNQIFKVSSPEASYNLYKKTMSAYKNGYSKFEAEKVLAFEAFSKSMGQKITDQDSFNIARELFTASTKTHNGRIIGINKAMTLEEFKENDKIKDNFSLFYADEQSEAPEGSFMYNYVYNKAKMYSTYVDQDTAIQLAKSSLKKNVFGDGKNFNADFSNVRSINNKEDALKFKEIIKKELGDRVEDLHLSSVGGNFIITGEYLDGEPIDMQILSSASINKYMKSEDEADMVVRVVENNNSIESNVSNNAQKTIYKTVTSKILKDINLSIKKNIENNTVKDIVDNHITKQFDTEDSEYSVTIKLIKLNAEEQLHAIIGNRKKEDKK